MKQVAFAFAVVVAVLAGSPSGAHAQLQEQPSIPREWYADVVLWAYGDDRPQRREAGCLRWGTHTRTWYDICHARREPRVSVRY
jgi:hypothetical protein